MVFLKKKMIFPWTNWKIKMLIFSHAKYTLKYFSQFFSEFFVVYFWVLIFFRPKKYEIYNISKLTIIYFWKLVFCITESESEIKYFIFAKFKMRYPKLSENLKTDPSWICENKKWLPKFVSPKNPPKNLQKIAINNISLKGLN